MVKGMIKNQNGTLEISNIKESNNGKLERKTQEKIVSVNPILSVIILKVNR